VSSGGVESNGASSFTRISTDGRYVVFHSDATNLVVDDTNGSRDVFVHDRQTGETTRISVSSSGIQGNGDSAWANRISTDSRYVSFASDASNLVDSDTNGVSDVFVHDRQTGETTRISVSSGGVESNGANGWGTISHDGRYVGFRSDASNLVADDTNGSQDVFVHDRQTGETTRVSVSSSGTQGNGDSDQISISTDSRYVGFRSDASNLVADDTNGSQDIFVHDRQTGEATRVSVSSNGVEGNEFSSMPDISSDGRYVTFRSDASNLVEDDTNGSQDIFVHDRQTGKTTRVSVSSSGAQTNGHSTRNYTSSDGRFVTFRSEASNLVVGDTNGVADIFVHERARNGGGNGGGGGFCFIAVAACE
jgi:cold shock CspA family protein